MPAPAAAAEAAAAPEAPAGAEAAAAAVAAQGPQGCPPGVEPRRIFHAVPELLAEATLPEIHPHEVRAQVRVYLRPEVYAVPSAELSLLTGVNDLGELLAETFAVAQGRLAPDAASKVRVRALRESRRWTLVPGRDYRLVPEPEEEGEPSLAGFTLVILDEALTADALCLGLEAGTFESADGQRLPPAPLSFLLPLLSFRDRATLQEQPRIALTLTPVVEDQRGDEDRATALDFRLRRVFFLAPGLVGAELTGHLATRERVTFNQIRGELFAEGNALPGDYLPVSLLAGVEADQSFDVANAFVGAAAGFLLPFNLNGSPPGPDYIPTAGPRVSVRLERGWKLGDDLPATGETSAAFYRAGYELRWRIALQRGVVVALHHAGIWRTAGGAGGRWRYHRLWDVELSARLGDLTYVVGYQQGETAPLYRPIETTRLGLSFFFDR